MAKKNKKKKLVIIIVSVVILACAAVGGRIWATKVKAVDAADEITWRTGTVKKGDIRQSLSGSGAVSPVVREDISSEVSGAVTGVFAKTGEEVKAGDVLFTLDDSDARLEYQRLVNSLKQKELDLQTLETNVSSLNITAPFSGRVTNLAIESGSTISKDAAVCELVDQSSLEVVLPFNGLGIDEIKEGMPATVFLQDIMQSVEGTVVYKASHPYYGENGGELYNIKIQVKNPGIITEGMEASAQIEILSGHITSTDVSSLKYINKTTIRCDAGGDVAEINIIENDMVEEGQMLARVVNEEAEISRDSNELQLKEAQLQVDLAEEDLTQYSIMSPIDGIVVDMDEIQIGDEVKSGDVLMTLVNTEQMEFDVTIDELDIAKVQVGQKAEITIDALEDTLDSPMVGAVTQIAIESDSKNGVTTYPVTISVPGRNELLGGMNANAEILVLEEKDVLYIPIEAVVKRGDQAFVWVKADGDNSEIPAEGEAPERQDFSQMTDEERAALRQRFQEAGDSGQGQRSNSGENGNSSWNNQQNTGDNTPQSGERSSSFRAGGGISGSGYYQGAVMVPIETGINNESYIEILEGLNEGDKIILPEQADGSGNGNTNDNTNNNFEPGGGGMMSPVGGMGRMMR